MSVKVKFWGVRGSVPSPITADVVEKKVRNALKLYAERADTSLDSPAEIIDAVIADLKRQQPFTYGGNTSCVEVRDGKNTFILDMGTGLRPFGDSLFPEISKNKGISVHFITSHVHWDHIQGLPFFGPLYQNKETGILNTWFFLGGTRWQKTAIECLRGQMDPPTFPVEWGEIKTLTHRIAYRGVHNGLVFPVSDGPTLTFRKLSHPQETYGVRFEFPGGPVIVYATDNEPNDPREPEPNLLTLAKDADVLIIDCQYTRGQYSGLPAEGGVSRRNWGHSYPEAVAETALQAKAKHVVLFHHDPASSDEKITEMRAHTEKLIRDGGGTQQVTAAWEGLELTV
ncbi:MAG: hypothetical protein A3D67_01040 [Candidatus Lloydbacteria bacterium RIFCSPHIGHO2_02_FULL_51_22]|uniref:Metallo-beta-lactamase domain-containing protein n=2 Tax=Candidatus Lloydiibacteriota TaxID=1817910 RepID=A0A1G2DA65_9BACT|nr:MAG: hypothetical protein A3D67_01040 [Candidatus Lloydbacteria bacterium RIFCSPHIGHO2_02_FULL_51_22]OGZ15027.1 MAG: hypothetical protein A3J08_01620 [Candidatus Lloydbacteria bacterium RIFCSPLOWO2_02_FULL_51_11]